MMRKYNNLSLKSKFTILLLFCVVVPVISLDILVASIYNRNEIKYEISEREEAIVSVKNNFENTISNLISLSNYIYTDESTYDYLYQQYDDEIQYYKNYLAFSTNSAVVFAETMNSLNGLKQIHIYTDNPTVIAGSYIQKIDQVESDMWYDLYNCSDQKQFIYCDVEKREISVITKLKYYTDNLSADYDGRRYAGILKLDLDMNSIDSIFDLQQINQDVYLSYRDQVISTNTGSNQLFRSYSEIVKDFSRDSINEEHLLNDADWLVSVITVNYSSWYRTLFATKALLPFLLLTILIPVHLAVYIEQNMVKRIELLENRFSLGYEPNEKGKERNINEEIKRNSIQYELMCQIEGDYGSDEIGRLITHYNKYIQFLKELMQQESKQREEKIALELSKKQAEINALNSQVNPHFLYNSIESICMRSVLKGERETAGIMRDLSVMLREASSWENEVKPLIEEIHFIQHYLNIHKYRFGDKIQCEIRISEECEQLIVPKLSVLCFVENACVHGIEDSIDGGVIQIIAFTKENSYVIQIKDNGVGMTENEQEVIRKRLQNVSIESFRMSKSTGIMNSYLRLQMLYGNGFIFSLDSLKDQGTTIQLQIKMNEVMLC